MLKTLWDETQEQEETERAAAEESQRLRRENEELRQQNETLGSRASTRRTRPSEDAPGIGRSTTPSSGGPTPAVSSTVAPNGCHVSLVRPARRSRKGAG